MSNEMVIGTRIREARVSKGWSQAQLARIVGSTQQTVARLESGQTEHSPVLTKILHVFSLPGCQEDETLGQEVPIVGVVGAGAQIFSIDDHAQGAGLETTRIPAGLMGKDAVGVIVRGDSMEPVYGDGDILFYDKIHRADLGPLLGKEVVARLVDGRTLVKKLHMRNGVLVLESFNAAPIVAPLIEWAARVAFVQRA